MKTYFITGTNTDCGKTYATCQLLSLLNQKQQRALALKPVASGCIEKDGELLSEDLIQLEAYQDSHGMNLCQWRFLPPVSPHLAAREAHSILTVEAIADFCKSAIFAHQEILLIEGAGGLMVPLNNNETWVDFLEWTGYPVIVVVGMRLGCINHALLTDELLKTKGIACAGWIANCLDKDMLFLNDNIAYLKDKMHMPLLATIPYKGRLKTSLIDGLV